MWQIWILVALISFAFEILTPSALVSVWFCGGALTAALVSLFTSSWLIQLCVFGFVSIACMALVRPVVKNVLFKEPEPTNSDRYIGQKAVLTRGITALHPGQIKLDGVEWLAASGSSQEIPAGTQVEITSIEGVKMIVRKVYQL